MYVRASVQVYTCVVVTRATVAAGYNSGGGYTFLRTAGETRAPACPSPHLTAPKAKAGNATNHRLGHPPYSLQQRETEKKKTIPHISDAPSFLLSRTLYNLTCILIHTISRLLYLKKVKKNKTIY